MFYPWPCRLSAPGPSCTETTPQTLCIGLRLSLTVSSFQQFQDIPPSLACTTCHSVNLMFVVACSQTAQRLLSSSGRNELTMPSTTSTSRKFSTPPTWVLSMSVLDRLISNRRICAKCVFKLIYEGCSCMVGYPSDLLPASRAATLLVRPLSVCLSVCLSLCPPRCGLAISQCMSSCLCLMLPCRSICLSFDMWHQKLVYSECFVDALLFYVVRVASQALHQCARLCHHSSVCLSSVVCCRLVICL